MGHADRVARVLESAAIEIRSHASYVDANCESLRLPDVETAPDSDFVEATAVVDIVDADRCLPIELGLTSPGPKVRCWHRSRGLQARDTDL